MVCSECGGKIESFFKWAWREWAIHHANKKYLKDKELNRLTLSNKSLVSDYLAIEDALCRLLERECNSKGKA